MEVYRQESARDRRVHAMYLQVAWMGQHRATAFNLAAHILDRGLLPVTGKSLRGFSA